MSEVDFHPSDRQAETDSLIGIMDFMITEAQQTDPRIRAMYEEFYRVSLEEAGSFLQEHGYEDVEDLPSELREQLIERLNKAVSKIGKEA
ncbi:MAG TPA: hypothetical protein VG964_00855 [Candidatus Saccharimonadales bacterium]|nr:hypothetical protein [Candidatus Saccharimonadales bacterium]